MSDYIMTATWGNGNERWHKDSQTPLPFGG